MKCPICYHETDRAICPICHYTLEEDLVLNKLLYKLSQEEINEYKTKIETYKQQYQSNGKIIKNEVDYELEEIIQQCISLLEGKIEKETIPATEAIWVNMRADMIIKSTKSDIPHLKDMFYLKDIYKTALQTYMMEDYYLTYQLCKIAEKEKDALAYLWLGILYEKGLGVKVSIDIAKNYYQKASELNNTLAMRRLGDIYLKEYIPVSCIDKGLKLYEKAIELKDKQALIDLIDKYHNGYGNLKPNKEKELELIQRNK